MAERDDGPNPWDDDESEQGARPVPDDGESCPLCGETVWPANRLVQGQTGVPWGLHHHAHALCALENLAARVAELERALARPVGTMRPRLWQMTRSWNR